MAPEPEVNERQRLSGREVQGYSIETELPLPGPLGRLVNLLADTVARIRVSVHLKLLAGFLILALLLLGMGILSLVVISRMNGRVTDLSNLQETVDRSRQMKYLVTAQSHFRAMVLICELVQPPPIGSANDCTANPPWNDRIAAAKQQFAAQLDELDRNSPPEQDEFFAGVRQTNARYAAAGERALNFYEAGDTVGALTVHIDDEHEISHQLEASMDQLISESTGQMREATAAFRSDRNGLTRVVAVVSGVSLVTALSLGFVLSWAFIRPVRRIDHVLAKIARGDFTQRVEVPNRDEFGTLSANLNHTSGRLASLYAELQSLNENLQQKVDEQVEELHRDAQERERSEQELRVAHDIQLAFLPKELPDLPGWQVAAYYQPAREVGGDFYDFITLEDGLLGLVIGDVTDKGVPAALVMAATRSVIRAAAQRPESPGQVLERVNDLVCPEIPPNMFVTCFYGILDSTTGRLRYANAGHSLPYLRKHDGVIELHATGMPLGLLPGMTYEENVVTLAASDSVLFHSDGLVEAHSPTREMFGSPRLMGLVRKHEGGRGLIDVLLGELATFTGPGWDQEDDVTLMTLQHADGP